MKQFNLEEYLKNPSRKVVTRSGIPVKIHCTNFATCKPVIAEISGRGYSQSFTKEGRYFGDTDDSGEELFFAPEKKEGWANIYKQDARYRVIGYVYETKEEAERNKDIDYITTIKIEWEE